jgi:hypothetical protein
MQIRTVAAILPGVKALVGLVIVLVAASSAVAATRPPATLRLTLEPLSVRGSHFAPRERVVVRARAGERSATRTIITTRMGTFSLSLAFVAPWDPCLGPLSITAVGPHDHVTLKRPSRECPPPG